jgi:hypothetical protein
MEQLKNTLVDGFIDKNHWIKKAKRRIGSVDVLIPCLYFYLALVKNLVFLLTEWQLVKKFKGFDFNQLKE